MSNPMPRDVRDLLYTMNTSSNIYLLPVSAFSLTLLIFAFRLFLFISAFILLFSTQYFPSLTPSISPTFYPFP